MEKHLIRFLILLISITGLAPAKPASRPNIVWIVVDDMSCHFGFQGEKRVRTPHVDRLAREGVVFENAYATAPVCSASRSAMITGMYQTSIGAHHHRSSRGVHKTHLPPGVRTVPELFREAGYFTCSAEFEGNRPEDFKRAGKEDYNFTYRGSDLYDGTDWSGRAEGQPFFAQVQLRGGKLRNVQKWQKEAVAGLENKVSPADVTLPPYYPDHPAFREDWADYLNSVQYTDREVGLILARLDREKLLDNTIIVFITDHGISQARGKQFLYDEGAKIPFIVRVPDRRDCASVRKELIALIDLAATSLAWAGVEIPPWIQARDLFAENHQPREFVAMARDRCDETEDRIRAIREGNFKYIRNFHPLRPYLQPCAYKDAKPWMQPLRDLHKAGELNAAQALQLADTRPEEELYDLINDPFEIHNLADEPEQKDRLVRLRRVLSHWENESGDHGRRPESEANYDSEMAAYLEEIRRNDLGSVAKIEGNIALMKRWRAAGK